MRLIPVWSAIALVLAAHTVCGAKGARLRELGAPVRGVNWVRLIPGPDGAGRECLYATMGQNAEGLIVLRINPLTGRFRQFVAQAPGSNFPTAAIWGKDGRLYVGAAYSGHLLRFDPKKDELEDLGAINPSGRAFPCRMDLAPDGSVFIGWWGEAGLTRFDPRTGRFTQYGRCDDVDMYNYPLVSSDGIVACQIGVTRPHVVLVNPETGAKKTVGPTITAGAPGKSLSIFRGTDGGIYITSSEGNFHIEGMEAKPVQQLPAAQPEPALADGSTFGFADAGAQEYRELVIANAAADSKRQFHLDYRAAGSDIFILHLGPDGKLYGSTYMPLHLFRYDPQSNDLQDLGVCSNSSGDAYSMGNLDGKMYICSYPAAVLSVYDPARPYHFGGEPNDNPRDLGSMDGNISCRPRAMLTGPLGRVWIGSYPNYGMWGGPLSWYDPQTGEKKSYRYVLEDQSVTGLVWSPALNLIVGSTSVGGGSGTAPKAKNAAVFLWDPVGETRVWWRAPRQGTRAITSLIGATDGMVYGFASGRDAHNKSFYEVFVFSPQARRFTSHIPIGENAPDCALRIGSDGKVYLVTLGSLLRIEPASAAPELVAHLPQRISIPGPLVGKTLYVGIGHRLCAIDLP